VNGMRRGGGVVVVEVEVMRNLARTWSAVDRIGVGRVAAACCLPWWGRVGLVRDGSIVEGRGCGGNGGVTMASSLERNRCHGRHDTTDYEETAPLTSLSEISRTVSRESSTRIMSGTGTTVEHPRRV
jgi:hypothetical protein